jgi:CHAT domain-containing protein/tetratricopeptide (TPR) repeat protein
MPWPWLILWAALAGGTASAASPPTEVEVTVGARIEGALRAPGAPADTVLFASAAAQTVTVLVESLDADTRVSVVDDAGRTVAADDQGGVGDNPRLVVGCAAGRTYRIRVEGASAADAGPYQLQVLAGDTGAPAKKSKGELDLAYYARVLERARSRGAQGRRRAAWALVRSSEINGLLGLASGPARLVLAEEALALARQAGDRPLEAMALDQCALAQIRANRPERALPLLEESRAIYREMGDEAGGIGPLSSLGLAYSSLEKLDQARGLFEEALALCQKVGDKPRSVRVLSNLAMIHNYLGQDERAVEYTERALQAAREVGDERLESVLLGHRAKEHARLNNYGLAIEYNERSLELARGIGHVLGEANALSSLAEVYNLVGRPQKALRCAEDALVLRRRLGETRHTAFSLTVLGALYASLERYPQALACLQEARTLLVGLNADNQAVSALAYMAEIHETLGEWQRARETHEEELRIASRTERRTHEVEARAGLALSHLHLGDPAQAATLAQQTLDLLRHGEGGEPTVEAAVRTTLARAAAALGRPARAREELDTALALIEGARTEAGGDLNRAGFLDRRALPFEAYVALLAEQGSPGEALALAERARARAFLDLLGSRRGAAAAPPSLEQIKEEARRRRVTFLEYFVSDERLFIWVVTPQGQIHAAVSPVGRSQLTGLVRQMRSALNMDVAARDWEAPEPEEDGPEAARGPATPAGSPTPRPEDARRTLRQLYDVLVRPAAAWLPREPEAMVTIVPHGPLFLVSFAALLDPQGRYLVERHTLSYTPSIGTLAHLDGRPRPGTPAAASRILVVGNPAMPSLPGRTRRPIPLPGAEAETRAIGRLYPAARVTTLTGTAAEERRVRELAPGFSIVHLATHGFIRDDEPEESLLALAPSPHPEGRPALEGDGLLTVREISGLRLRADLVILSGCNTGLGRISGDGVIGLARAFLQAGTPGVLASLWRVADLVAHPHMEHFHRALRHQGGHPASALRRAQLATIRDLRAQRYRTGSGAVIPDLPTYWAAFVLIGDPH